MDETRIAVELPATVDAPRVAREVLQPLAESHAARAVASELVTHAVLFGAPPIFLGAFRDGSLLVIEVCDSSPGDDWRDDERYGRAVVEVLSVASGTDFRPGDGTRVWAVVDADADDFAL